MAWSCPKTGEIKIYCWDAPLPRVLTVGPVVAEHVGKRCLISLISTGGEQLTAAGLQVPKVKQAVSTLGWLNRTSDE